MRVAIFVMCCLWATTGVAKSKKNVPPIDQELEKYWNVELAVPTITNPSYVHKGALEGTVAFGMVPNDSYYVPLALSLRGAYHMTETLALELGLSYLGVGGDSDLHTFLKEAGKEGFLKGVRKPSQMIGAAALDLMFRPFHGKLGVFDKKLSSFDLAFVAGFGVISADVDATNEIEDPLVNEIFIAGHWGVTLRFFLNKWMTIRADYRHFVFQPYKDTTLFPVEATIGVSFLSL